MAASLSAELLKLRKRPAVWVLALIWLLLVVGFGYFLTYAFLSNPPAPPEDAPAALEEQQQQAIDEQLKTLYPQNIPSNIALGLSGGGGAAIALILAAMAVGSEYGWDAFKTILARRPGRAGVFGGKLAGLGVVLVALLVLSFAAAAVSSYVIAGMEGASTELPAATEMVKAFGASLLILAVWAAMGAFLATLFRGTALAIGIGLVYLLAFEGIGFSVLNNIAGGSETLETIQKFLPGQNSNFLASSFTPEATLEGFGLQAPPVDPWQAALTLGGYLLVFVALSLLLFKGRDVA